MNISQVRKLIEDVNNKLEHEKTYYENITKVSSVFDNTDEIPRDIKEKLEKSRKTMELLSEAISALNKITLLK